MSGSSSNRLFGTVALAAGIGAAVLGFLWSPFTARARRDSGPVPNVAPDPELALLSQRIQALLDVMAERDDPGRSRSTLVAPDAPATRDPLPSTGPSAGPSTGPATDDSSHAELLEALSRLERVVREEARSTRALLGAAPGERAVLDRLKDAERPADWSAWEPILALWRQDPGAARAEVKLLTDQEVLDRFGGPTDVWSVDQGITWQYARDRDPLDGSYGTEIILRVPEGYVTQLAVRGRDW